MYQFNTKYIIQKLNQEQRSVSWLSMRLGISKSSLYYTIHNRGLRKLDYNTLRKIADFYKEPVENFVDKV